MTENTGAPRHDDDDRKKPFMGWSWSADDQNLALALAVLLLFLGGALGLSQCSQVSDAASDLGITSSDDDDDLLERTEDALVDDDYTIGKDDNEVDVRERAGVITLTGVVASQALKDQAGETAADVDGVTRVANNLVVAEDDTPPATTAAPAPTTTAAPAPTTTAAPAPTTTAAPAPVITPVAFTGTYADGAITIAGEVPDEVTRAAVIDGFGQQYEPQGITIIDELTINENTELQGGTLALVGEVPDPATRTAIVSDAETVASTVDMTVSDELTVLATDESLLADLNAVFATGGDVLFAPSSAELTAEATDVLDQAISILNQDPDLAVTIEGHTDSDGSEAANLELSDARANAVLSYFTNNGISADRLTAIGKGEGEPVADNATPEGKRQNRRIEFSATDEG